MRSQVDIRHLADAVENAQMILTKLDMLKEVDSQRTIMEIVSIYPNFVQNRWKRKVFKTKKAEGSYPDFDASCQFAMEIASEIASAANAWHISGLHGRVHDPRHRV